MKKPSNLWLRYWPILAVLIGMYVLDSGWAAILLYHCGIIGAIVVGRVPWKESLTGFRWLPSAGLFSAGVLAAPLVVILLPILLGMSPLEAGVGLKDGLARAGLSGVQFWLFVAYLCLPHPVIEELGWREILFVESRTPHLRDFEFASYHILVMHFFFPHSWIYFAACLLALAFMGWIWRLLKMKYGGLAVPIWFHAGGDLGAMIGVWWLIR